MRLLSCPLEGKTGHEAALELLTQAYFAQTGQPLPAIARTPRGKPYFPDSPYHFSISHTSRHAFVVLAQYNIAIDAEELDRRVDPRLAQRILSPQELKRYQASPDPNRALLRLWVLKEAAAKLSGRGLEGFPNHTDFSPDDPRLSEQDGCILAILGDPPPLPPSAERPPLPPARDVPPLPLARNVPPLPLGEAGTA